ncbi:hypothetical protein V5799_021920 [Amblyomma americanum]|uniref:Uncharacterized protein n=1 Tax=Amblyomma americanum TaxID=6943 RepID=A0AAQ4FM06_AMBAM
MFGVFRRAIAISSSSNDTSFKCLSATLTHYDPRTKKATYVWHLKARGEKPAIKGVLCSDLQAVSKA